MRAVSVRLEKHKAAKKVEMAIGNARVHPGLRTVGEGSGTVGDGGEELASLLEGAGGAGGGGGGVHERIWRRLSCHE